MRNLERIDKFCNELATIWKDKAPDLRFGQIIFCVFDSMVSRDPFFPEEDEMIKYIRNCFERKE